MVSACGLKTEGAGAGPGMDLPVTIADKDQEQQHHHDHDHADMSDDEDDFDFDEEYFLRTYRPLSNLPTPPPSSKNSSAYQSPNVEVEDDELLQPSLLGPAIHLVNLLPPAASLVTPSVSLVQAILSRANLPLHTVALAVCIMDSLNSRFARQWRLSCPLAAYPDADLDFDQGFFHEGDDHLGSNGAHSRQTSTSSFGGRTLPAEQLHIDSVCPELIVLSALVIAAKFTEDAHEPTQWYAYAWGRRLWTCDQINATERCLMENLGYRIMPLTAPDVLADALSDMARAAMDYSPNGAPTTITRGGGGSGSSQVPRSCCVGRCRNESIKSSKGCRKTGSAVVDPAGNGLAVQQQLTPADTP